MKNTIMAVLLDKRTDVAPRVQEILTEYGSIINARIGLHRAGNSPEEGLILLHLNGEDEVIEELQSKLSEQYRVQVKKMVVSFD